MSRTAALPTGEELHARVCSLLPIPRSLTGAGVRQTLAALRRWCDVEVHEIPTGTVVHDWTVPREWVLRRATLTGPDGTTLADSDVDPLSVVGYSVPVSTSMTLEQLQPHLHSIPEQPDWTPYRTSYYAESWGFCLPDRIRGALQPGRYRVRIDTDLIDGHLTYGEVVIDGDGDEIGVISAHVCHPGMANDNASGNVVAAALAAHLQTLPTRLSWRVVFAPGTIGPLVWLTENADLIDRIRAGFVLAGVGDGGRMSIKASRHGHTLPERALVRALEDRGRPYDVLPWSPWGYDERQYTAPGFGLPVTLVMRTPHGTYPQYHTSADNSEFVRPQALADTLDTMVDVVRIVDANTTYLNHRPYGEPQLGKRGLYPTTGGSRAKQATLAMLWVLAMSDGATDLLAIAERSGMAYGTIAAAAENLLSTDLLGTAAR